MIHRGAIVISCLLMSSCASKQLQTSIKTLEAENKTLRGDVAKLQTQVQALTNDILVVQTRVEHQPTLPTIRAATPVVETAKPAEPPKKMFRQESFLGDDMKFTDDEAPTAPILAGSAAASTGSSKFTNRDLGSPLLPNQPSRSPSAPVKSKSGAFTEQTLVEDSSKTLGAAPAGKSNEDPAITAAYNRAYKTFQDQNYKETVRLMDDFLKQYPSHQYSDNAVFWMGESYYQLKNYEQAHAEFEKVVAKYPNGNKVPDALLRSGICMIKLSKPEKAKSSFDQLIKKYPESVAAKKAKATLGEM
jgi:tol-pal system protein YbgF